MNASAVVADLGRKSKAKAKCFASLPEVSCAACGSEWLCSDVWYPSVRLKDKSKRKCYSRDRIVSLEELDRLRAGLKPKSKAKRMPPGSEIGPIEAQLSPYATDFVWNAFQLLAPKPVIQKFEQHGIIVPHGPAVVYLGRTRSEGYVALELEPRALCSPKTEEALGIGRCDTCGAVRRLKGFDNDVIDNLRYEFIAAKAPEDHGLMLEDVEDFILASNPFIEVYRRNKMTGLRFDDVGIWV
jgi:hypothetical protein